MWRYRYRRDYLADAELVARLNDLGEQGWSLLGPPRWVPPEYDSHGTFKTVGLWACFLRRTVTTREQVREVFSLSPEREEDGP